MLRELTSCLCSAAAWAVCFEYSVAGVNATGTGNEVVTYIRSCKIGHKLCNISAPTVAPSIRGTKMELKWNQCGTKSVFR